MDIPSHTDSYIMLDFSVLDLMILACTRKWGLCEYVIVHTMLGGGPVILWILLGGKPKWLLLKFGFHDVMRTSPIHILINAQFNHKTKRCSFVFSLMLVFFFLAYYFSKALTSRQTIERVLSSAKQLCVRLG